MNSSALPLFIIEIIQLYEHFKVVMALIVTVYKEEIAIT